MTICVGEKLPGGSVMQFGANGPEPVDLATKLAGRNVIIFGLPGAFTGTCSTAHVPSFVRTAEQLAAKGVDEIICMSVNDPFVMKAWSDSTGAGDKGISMLGDAEGAFTSAIGMMFSVPQLGLVNRSKRYALYAEDGVVKVFHPEPGTGCEISTGEAMLAAI